MFEVNFENDKGVKRVMNSTESKNRISGCLFGFIGLIVLGFGIFLCNRGAHSQRKSQILSYIENVFLWNSKYSEEFSNIHISIQQPEKPKKIGEITEDEPSKPATPKFINAPLHKGTHEFSEWPLYSALGRVTED